MIEKERQEGRTRDLIYLSCDQTSTIIHAHQTSTLRKADNAKKQLIQTKKKIKDQQAKREMKNNNIKIREAIQVKSPCNYANAHVCAVVCAHAAPYPFFQTHEPGSLRLQVVKTLTLSAPCLPV